MLTIATPNGSDPVTLTLETLVSSNGADPVGCISRMALVLDAAMALSGPLGELRRRQYAQIWGQEWRPLVLDAIDELDSPALAHESARYERSLSDTLR